MAWEHGKVRYFEQTSAPTVNDDENDGYRISDIWINRSADTSYRCLDASAGAAVWEQSTGTAHAQNTDTALGIQTEILDMGGYKIHDLGSALHQEDAANLKDVINSVGIALNYWLGSANQLTQELVHSPAFYPQMPSGSQELGDIGFKTTVAGTPTPLVIKDNTLILVHFHAYSSSITGRTTYKLQAELWSADADGNAENQIGARSNFTDTLSTDDTILHQLEIIVVDEFILAAGKRLFLRIWATEVIVSGGEPTLYVAYDEVHNHLTIPVSGSVLGRYLHLAGGEMTGNITMSGVETVDGRDLSVDGAVLDILDAELTDWLASVVLGSNGLTTIPQLVLTPSAAAIAAVEGGIIYNNASKAVYVCTEGA